MIKNRIIIHLIVATSLMMWLMSSCDHSVRSTQKKQAEYIDSLNQLAYLFHYKDLDSCLHYATLAYQQTENYAGGKAEAINHLAFHAFMKMDFEQSRAFLTEVYRTSNNELERLIADIGMMKICQRTSSNKAFYDHRNSALKRIKRIGEEVGSNLLSADSHPKLADMLNRHEQERLIYAISDFHIVSSIYYYYLQQEEQALEEINLIDPVTQLANDTTQLIYYYYMKGSGGLCEGKHAKEIAIREFDYLAKGITLSRQNGYIYFEANMLQAFAELMLNKESMQAIHELRPSTLQWLNPESLPDSLLTLSLAHQALDKFKSYNDTYQIAGAYRTISSCLIANRIYAEAVDSLQRALDYVNEHHQNYYACNDSAHTLRTYRPNETEALEMEWLTNESIQTVPEWIARIREQLCLAYSGLGMKKESDYNRNIYLDILDVTRQDKELESRYDLLEQNTQLLNAWLAGIVLVIAVLLIALWMLNKRWKRNNAQQIERLKQTLEICRKITASIPNDVTNEKEIPDSIIKAIQPDLEQLFGPCQPIINLENKSLQLNPLEKLNKERRTLLKVMSPYITWSIDNGSAFVWLREALQEIDVEYNIHRQRLVQNKRENTMKKACFAIVTGITPYLDRIINEIHKLRHATYAEKQEVRQAKYQYIGELANKINEYNDILALWIKMKQGKLSFHIKSFSLNELFKMLNKKQKTFEAKGQTFLVELMDSQDAQVKGDEALTMFMLNTLTENARKFTPRGGTIRVYAQAHEKYVEISVEDNGIGLSEADCQRILNEKVYDSHLIGMNDEQNRETLKKNKGSGFGLINCKGIIEKYKKTNSIFQVCLFGIESEKGKGSRFFFRLPKTLMWIALFAIPTIAKGEGLAYNDTLTNTEQVIMDENRPVNYYDESLEKAARFADSAYYKNVYGQHRQAIDYVDSALVYLNHHHAMHNQQKAPTMQRSGKGEAAEISWWQQWFDTDYHVILDLRNEAAVASLALRHWEDYRYNNRAYTRLYKLLSVDNSLEKYCQEMQQSANNKTISIILCLLIGLIIAVGYYLLYFRRRILHRLNLEQVLEINREVLASSLQPIQSDTNLCSIPEQILQNAFDSINDLLNLQAWGMAVYHEDTHRLHFTYYPSVTHAEEMEEKMRKCHEQQKEIISKRNNTHCLPLYTELGEEKQYLGAIAFVYNHKGHSEDESLLTELIARYISIVIMNTVVRMENKYRDIEQAQDEKLRAQYEEDRIYVQNQVLDNCLSTIKHETIYYPNKIGQTVQTLLKGVPEEREKELIVHMAELAGYYKDIFTLLSSCASRQLEDITFRRSQTSVEEILNHTHQYADRRNCKRTEPLDIEVLPTEMSNIEGDAILIANLLENLVDVAMSLPQSGKITLSAKADNGFIRFEFTDNRGKYTEEELNRLFYPDLERMQTSIPGQLQGTEYLLCKQIIREHDEYTGYQGCRINAEPLPDGGKCIWFTIPIGKGKPGNQISN